MKVNVLPKLKKTTANTTHTTASRGRQAVPQGGMYYPPGQNPYIQPYIPKYNPQPTNQPPQAQASYVQMTQPTMTTDQSQYYQTHQTQTYTTTPQMMTQYPETTNQPQQLLQYPLTSDNQFPVYTTHPGQGVLIQGGYSVARIERPCYLYFVEYAPSQPTTMQPQGLQQQPAELRYTPVTSHTGTQSSTFQY